MNFQVERLKQLPQRARERWQGGLIRMPAWVTDTDDTPPFRPWGAMWVSLATHMVSQPAIEPIQNKNLSMALDNLVQFACDKKFAGYRPGILEVKDPALAEYLQGTLMDAGIAVEYHPKLTIFEEVLASLTKTMDVGELKLLPDALSAKRVTVDMMRSFAEAATEFYNAHPWQHLSTDDLIAIETPFTEPALRYATILGMAGFAAGIGFYESAEKYERFVIGHDPEAMRNSSNWAIFFGKMSEMPFGDADLWEDYNLPVASPDAYPVAAMYDPKGKDRRPQPDILAFLEGLMRAVAQTTESEMDSGRWEKMVHTFAGNKTFTLALPRLQESAEEARKKMIKHGGMPDRRAMEKVHLDIERIIEGREFKSPEEMQEFLNNNLVGKKVPEQYPMTPREQAQDLCYEAFEARGRKKIILAKKALELYPDCVDAYVLLAENCPDPEKANQFYTKGVEAGEGAMGEQFFKENVGHFWGITRTRPYMRAKAGTAETLKIIGRIDEAIEHYQDMLRLNPNDNQGMRDTLLPLLIENGRIDDAEMLWKQYKDDVTAVWHYARALLTFIQKGDCNASRKQLAKAIKKNAHVPKYLLGKENIPPIPQSYSLGSKEEAVVCVDEIEDAWDSVPAAMHWLEKHDK